MSYLTYKILHIIGIAALFLGMGGMLAGGTQRKLFAIFQGIGLLCMLVSGFGLLARLQIGFPHFAILKTSLWVVVGALPVLFRRLKVPTLVAILISLGMVGLLAWIGLNKPVLW